LTLKKYTFDEIGDWNTANPGIGKNGWDPEIRHPGIANISNYILALYDRVSTSDFTSHITNFYKK